MDDSSGHDSHRLPFIFDLNEWKRLTDSSGKGISLSGGL